ncbi:Endonuclease, Uma2 family (restriction endonuclease fold) [Flavobacterium micromati]|uniref:Endonuclease, Uma2 family (Restriction endonuclease fold) n=1 Tax=Flavobacterium micromati TaxID=229205 RepID=A0A1M5LID4_9FLAO|nr:Uma2 family endonuclease [Flavobacterium micromati]SHG64778.1 Endonuclease, Uma2 family (restriction endonuclease fold) [Flavobacterium micromati]
MITNISQLDLTKKYSYADYLTWMFQERLELFKGKIFKMSPTPSMYHQKVAGNIHGILWNKFKTHSCNVFVAPFDVRLGSTKNSKNDTDIYTVVQPDLCVICDENNLDARGAIGAPELMIEILSPGNSKKEMRYKYDLYQEAGVLEYWIVNPENKTIFIYVLKDGIFVGQHPLIEDDNIESPLFPQLDFKLEEIFN